MTDATQRNKPRRRPGRPTKLPLPESIRARCTQDQLEKYIALGGSAWLRQQIDAAPEPEKGGNTA